MITISGVLVLLSGLLLPLGLVTGTPFVYASLVMSLTAAALLVLGAGRRARRVSAS